MEAKITSTRKLEIYPSKHNKEIERKFTQAEELESIAKRLAVLAEQPYCWEDILDRLYHGYQLPFKFEE